MAHTTTRGIVKTLGDGHIEAGERFYKSTFYREAMKAMRELSLDFALQGDGDETDTDPDLARFDVEDVEGELPDLTWGYPDAPEALFTEFFASLKKEVQKNRKALERNPGKFRSFFNGMLHVFLAKKRGDTDAVLFWEKEVQMTAK